MVQIMGCWEALRDEFLAGQQYAQEHMTLLLEESCRLLKPSDGRWRYNLDRDFVDQQRFGLVREDEIDHFPKVWIDAAEEEVEDCLCSLR